MIIMRQYSKTTTMRPPSLVTWLWYRLYCRMRPPRSECMSREIKSLKWARWVPERFTAFHETYARRHGLFWLPCVLCMTPYGGHQSAGSVPDPTQPPAGPLSPVHRIGVCTRCTRAGKGD